MLLKNIIEKSYLLLILLIATKTIQAQNTIEGISQIGWFTLEPQDKVDHQDVYVLKMENVINEMKVGILKQDDLEFVLIFVDYESVMMIEINAENQLSLFSIESYWENLIKPEKVKQYLGVPQTYTGNKLEEAIKLFVELLPDSFKREVQDNDKVIWGQVTYYGEFKNENINGAGILVDSETNENYITCDNFVEATCNGYGEIFNVITKSKEYEGQFVNTQREGKGIEYRLNGLISAEGTFLADSKEGTFTERLKNGEESSTSVGNYVNNKREGIWNVKRDDGLEVEIDFSGGEEISSRVIHKADAIMSETAPSKKEYRVGLFLSDNETNTEITITSVNTNSVAEKAGIMSGDKLMRINGTYFADMGARAAHEWLKSTDIDEEYEIEYFDISTNESVTVYLKPFTLEFKELKRETFENYVENAKWGDDQYSGQLDKNVPHGKGKIVFANGDIYEGELDHGEMTGQGIMTYADGSIYRGGWEKDQKHGQSVYINTEGVEQHGEYDYNKKKDFFFIVYSEDNIIQEYYDDDGYLLFEQEKALEEVAKYIGRSDKEDNEERSHSTNNTGATDNTSTINNTSTTDNTNTTEINKVGVGIVIGFVGRGRCNISRSKRGWASYDAGIVEGMQILEIDGVSIKEKLSVGEGKNAIIRVLEGEKGSSVLVKICPQYKPEEAKTYRLFRGENGKAELIK